MTEPGWQQGHDYHGLPRLMRRSLSNIDIIISLSATEFVICSKEFAKPTVLPKMISNNSDFILHFIATILHSCCHRCSCGIKERVESNYFGFSKNEYA